MQQPNRNFTSKSYRYGFQGQEKDDELKGEGNSVNYKYRMHDPRIGRFFAVDPLSKSYPHYTPYSFSGNKVVHAIELEGLEEKRIIYFKNEQDAKAVITATNNGEQIKAISEAINAANNNVAGQVIVDTDDMDIISVVYLREGLTSVKIFEAKSEHFNFIEKGLNWLSNNSTGGFMFSDGGFMRSGLAGKPRKGSNGTWIDFDGGLTALIASLSVGKKGNSPGSGNFPKGKGTNGGKPTLDDKISDAVRATQKTSKVAKENTDKATQQVSKDTTLTIQTLNNIEITQHQEGKAAVRLTPGNVTYKTTTDKVDSLNSAIAKKNKKTVEKSEKVLDSLLNNPPKN